MCTCLINQDELYSPQLYYYSSLYKQSLTRPCFFFVCLFILSFWAAVRGLYFLLPCHWSENSQWGQAQRTDKIKWWWTHTHAYTLSNQIPLLSPSTGTNSLSEMTAAAYTHTHTQQCLVFILTIPQVCRKKKASSEEVKGRDTRGKKWQPNEKEILSLRDRWRDRTERKEIVNDAFFRFHHSMGIIDANKTAVCGRKI